MLKNQKLKFKSIGFTIIELAVVITIIVILIGISIAVFANFQPDLQLNGSARNLVTDLRYVQQLTVTEQIKYCLKFFLSEKKYQIIQCGSSEFLSEISLPDGIRSITTSGFTNDEIEFNPYGAVKESGSVVLENTNNKTKTIEIRPSGFVRISE